MDYSSYKTMCDTSLEQIRKSENKRQELDHKLQKMYQEKSECEKSIIKTLQSQQKEFIEEKRRRAERNESILRTLERIDYQASTLAAKTERLRTLKKQYEKYLLSLWNRRRQAAYPPSTASTTSQRHLLSQFVAKYDDPLLHQSSMSHDYEVKSNYPRFSNALQSSTNYPSIAMNYSPNLSYFREMPFTPAENPIRISNYRTTGAVIEPQYSYPPTHRVRYDDSTQTLLHHQPSSSSVGNKSFYYSNNNNAAVNNDDTFSPTTINSIYRDQQPPQHRDVPRFPPFDDISTAKPFHSIYQRNNQPLENRNYNSEKLRVSETSYGTPFMIPASETLVTQAMPSLATRETLSALSSEILLKSHSETIPINTSNATNVHMSDGDEESDGEKFSSSKMIIRRSDSISDDTFRHQKPLTKGDVETLFKKQADNSRMKSDVMYSPEETDAYGKSLGRIEFQETSHINDSTVNENMHQVWERIVSPEAQHVSSFVIPKIIVETQIDLAEATPMTTTTSSDRTIQYGNQEGQGTDSPELLTHEMERHSTDNQQNESLPSRAPQASTVNNNLPLEEVGSSIYHYDKQPFGYEQQNHQKLPQSRVENSSKEIFKPSLSDDEATRAMTHDSEIKTNNSLAEGISDDRGEGGRRETINNINDDKNQSTSSLALNDKINEIYRKIEKIEDKYYDEKGKIIESFERRMSSSSLNDAAKAESQSVIDIVSLNHDATDVESGTPEVEPEQVSDMNIQELQLDTNEMSEHDGSERKIDPQQSRTAADEIESLEMPQPDYNYIENENQPNYNPEAYSPQYQIEGQHFDNNKNDGLDAQRQTNFSGIQFDDSQYQDLNIEPYQQQSSELVYPHHDNSQNYQQQEANNYNPSYAIQLDSNYQQNNYDEAQEISSNYTNDSAGVYYDYDQNLQQQNEEAPQIMYDDQNYSHQQQASSYQSNDEGASQPYFYDQNDENKADMNEEHSNENNYAYTENLNETSGDDGATYNSSKYQTEATTNNDFNGGASMYESQTVNETSLENANYESQQFEQESNETYEQMNEVSYEKDDSYLTTTASTSSGNSKPLETEVKPNENRDADEKSTIQQTKRDDIKLVKQLLDSESDDTTTRSNLLKTSIKEEAEADESDFDFSAG